MKSVNELIVTDGMARRYQEKSFKYIQENRSMDKYVKIIHENYRKIFNQRIQLNKQMIERLNEI
jgi:hypothetical protein